MLGHEIIHLLDLKNNALEDFANQNDLFLKLSKTKAITIEHFKVFYGRREEILQKINKIDVLIERACSFREMDFVETQSTKNDVMSKQKIKKHLVTKIIEQDLEIMSMYAEAAQQVIE